MNSKYSSFQTDSPSTSSSDNSSGDDYERDLTLKWKPNATFRGALNGCFGSDNQWGQSLGIKFDDGKLVDGVLMERLGNDGQPDGTLKLFPWESMPVILNDELSADDAPEVFTEEFGSRTYRYQLKAARVEGDEESGIPADPAEPIEFGTFMMWESGGEKPSSTAKTMAQTLTSMGRDVIVDREDGNNWLDVNSVEAREDLIGRELDVFKVIKQGPNHQFHTPIVIDVKTGAQVKIADGFVADSEPEEEEESKPEPEAADDANEAPAMTSGGMPEPMADFVEFCRDFGLTDEDQILTNLNEMADEADNSLTSEMVDSVGTDAILAAIVE